MKDKKVLVLGGLGFMGINLVHRLWRSGNQVTIFNNTKAPEGLDRLGIASIEGDIRNKEDVKKAVAGQEVIFNVAGRSGQVDTLEDPYLDLDVNLKGVLNVLESVKETSSPSRIIFSGSRLQYGKTKYLPVDENHPMEPISIYGLQKVLGERYHLSYHHVFGIESVVLRFSNPYGPHPQSSHDKYNIFNLFIDKARKNENLTIFGEGNQLRDYLYIDDLVEAFISAASVEEANGEAINIGSGQGTKFSDMAQAVIKGIGAGELKNVPWPTNYKQVETGDFVNDITKAKELLKWEPKISLEEGIRKTVEFYEKYPKDPFFSLVI